MSVAPRIPGKLNPQFDCQGLWNFEGNVNDTCGLSPPANLNNSLGTPTQSFKYAQDHTGKQCLVSRGTDQSLIATTGITRLHIYGDITVQAVFWLPTMAHAPGGSTVIHHDGSNGAFPTENYLYALGASGQTDHLPPEFFWENPVNTHPTVRDDTATLDTGRWYHLVGVRDGTTGRLYTNGMLIKTELGMTLPAGGTNGRIRVGKDGSNNRGLQNGTMVSSLKISNRTLTADEIAQEYTRVRGSV